jgi:hypothetical protein
MKVLLLAVLSVFGWLAFPQHSADAAAVQKIIDDQVTAWNKGDAEAFARDFSPDGTFTNLLGMCFHRKGSVPGPP